MKTSVLSVIAVSATGFVRLECDRYVGDCETTFDILGPFYRPDSVAHCAKTNGFATTPPIKPQTGKYDVYFICKNDKAATARNLIMLSQVGFER